MLLLGAALWDRRGWLYCLREHGGVVLENEATMQNRGGRPGWIVGCIEPKDLPQNMYCSRGTVAPSRHGRRSSLCENLPSGILRGVFVSFAGRIARESEISAGGIQTGEIFSMRERRRRVFTQAACFGHPACGSIRPKSWMPACACMTGTVRPRVDPGQQSASSASDRNGDLSR